MNIKVNSKIEMLPIGTIKRHYGSHKTAGALKLLEESIRRYGITQPISVDSSHEVITGNGVYDAAVKLGIEQLPCIVVDYLTDEEIAQYRLADNLTGGFAAWNEGKLKKELSYLQDMQSVQFCFDESLQAMFNHPVIPSFGGKSITESSDGGNAGSTTEMEAGKQEGTAAFKEHLKGVEQQMHVKPFEYFEYTCSCCGKKVTVKI